MQASCRASTAWIFGAFLAVLVFLVVFSQGVSAHGEATPAQFGLVEGDLISATGDPDIYIVNGLGYKRLFLNPAIFAMYGHLRWENVKEVGTGVRDAFPTSGLFRDCEANDLRVYAVEVTAEDTGDLHWVDVAAEQVLVEDDDFFKKVFCINSVEFNWYAKSSAYDSLANVPVYSRVNLPGPAINETQIPLTLPDGFRISLFTIEALGPVRFMAFSPDGILFASVPSSTGLYKSRGGGKVIALPDRDGDGKADEVKTVLSGLGDLPHGLAFYNGYLYVAEESSVSRYPYLNDGNVGVREVVVANLPSGADHVSRTIGFSPSGKMYVSVGSSCNVCVEADARRAAIVEYNPDGTEERVFAAGLRNAVGFVFHPTTGEIWATENGRDWLGDDLPPDEINIVRGPSTSSGQVPHYGWPYCYGKLTVDPAFNNIGFCALVHDVAESVQPSIYDLQAHVAPLGLRFIEGPQFPSAWQGDLLVAYHGSWNRSVPVGYSVVRLDVSGNTILGEQDFISGWLRPDGSKLGRPVDLVFDVTGALYISDDYANTIYRVTKI